MLPLLMVTSEVESFYNYAGEIWTKSYGPNYTKFWA